MNEEVNFMKCAKCGGEMEEGFVNDSSDRVLDVFTKRTKCIRGGGGLGKKKSWWDFSNLGIQASGSENLPIIAFRCCGCGYLESYAK